MEISPELQSYIDRKFAKLEARIKEVEDELFKLAQDTVGGDFEKRLDALEHPPVQVTSVWTTQKQEPYTVTVSGPSIKPAEWSNRDAKPAGKWHFFENSEKLLLNRQNNTRMRSALTREEIAEASEDIPGFAPEADVDLPHEENP